MLLRVEKSIYELKNEKKTIVDLISIKRN